MRSRILTVALLLAGIGALPAFAQDRLESDTALASMVAAERAFAQHSVRAGTQSAFLSFMAENGVLYRPRAVKAHTWLRARPMPADLALVWEPVFADVSRAGDLGYTTGPWIGRTPAHRSAHASRASVTRKRNRLSFCLGGASAGGSA
mgnify:CR=1 FL=1